MLWVLDIVNKKRNGERDKTKIEKTILCFSTVYNNNNNNNNISENLVALIPLNFFWVHFLCFSAMITNVLKHFLNERPSYNKHLLQFSIIVNFWESLMYLLSHKKIDEKRLPF